MHLDSGVPQGCTSVSRRLPVVDLTLRKVVHSWKARGRFLKLDKVLVCCVHGSCGADCKEYMCEITIQSFRALDIWVVRAEEFAPHNQRLIGSCPVPDASSNRSRCSRLSCFLPALPCTASPELPLEGFFSSVGLPKRFHASSCASMAESGTTVSLSQTCLCSQSRVDWRSPRHRVLHLPVEVGLRFLFHA